MWFKKASPRRQAIREDLAELGDSVSPSKGRLRHVVLIAVVFGILAACLQFWPRNPMPYRVGELAPMDMVAPVNFRFVDPVELARARELARKNTEQVLAINESAITQLVSELRALRDNADAVMVVSQLPLSQRALFPSLNETSLVALQKAKDLDETITAFRNGALRAIPLIAPADREALLKRVQGPNHIPTEADNWVQLATKGTIETGLVRVGMDKLAVSAKEADPVKREEIRKLVREGGALSEPLVEVVTDGLVTLNQPLYTYEQKLTARLAENRAQSMMIKGPLILKGDRLVQRGEEITPSIYQELVQAQQALENDIARIDPWALWLNRVGLVLTAYLLTIGGAVFIARMAPGMTLRRLWAIAGLMWITMVAAKLIVVYSTIGLLGIAPTLLAAIILVIAETPLFALGLCAIQGLLVTLTLRQGVDFYVPLLAGAMIFCFGLREIRTRGKLIEVGAGAAMAVFAAVWALGFSRLLGLGWSRWIGTTDIHTVWAVAVAMFALAILPSVERVFKITTAMTLLELCDANKPLLRRLQQEAPGTFNHSLNVGTMAEAAGNAVGANGLLCRVGAYYHDVGKLGKPQYFIENQMPGHPNRHDKLSPAMSLLVIVGHVKDGIELAREYGLPWVVHEFIAQHQGTTLVEYFYHAARKRAVEGGVEDGRVVSDTEFRYPGPKPQTRETAIVMICDGCESVVRSIDEPTPGRIEAAVHTMIMKRLMDGQFSECDLTLRELSIIEETLARTLMGIHHGRAAYPSDRGGEPDIGVSQPA